MKFIPMCDQQAEKDFHIFDNRCQGNNLIKPAMNETDTNTCYKK